MEPLEKDFDFEFHPAASVRLHTTRKGVEATLRRMTAGMPWGGLSVTVVLEESDIKMKSGFMDQRKANQERCSALGRVDLRRTSLLRMGDCFLRGSQFLTSVTFPPSLTEVGCDFLQDCEKLHCVDMGHTALHGVGRRL